MITTKVRIIEDDRDYKELYRGERRCRRFMQDVNAVLLLLILILVTALVWVIHNAAM